jgi:prephenate dehydratase
MRIALLGPEGTFSHSVALSAHPEGELIFCDTIDDVLTRLSDSVVECAVAPLVNSLSGYVEETIEHILEDPICVIGKRIKAISHYLVGDDSSDFLFCHPHTYQQCKLSVQRLCPHCEVVLTKSNGESAVRAKNEKGLAIIPPFATEIYPLPIIAKDVQDTNDNQTTFLFFSREGVSLDQPTQTLFILSRFKEEMDEEAISDLFNKSAIKVNEINSLFLHNTDEEIFLIECMGSYREPIFEEVLQELGAMCHVKVLGAYGEKRL